MKHYRGWIVPKSAAQEELQAPYGGVGGVLGKPIGKYIETVFSSITNLFSKKIHAVTPGGFELKIVWFLLAFAFQCL